MVDDLQLVRHRLTNLQRKLSAIISEPTGGLSSISLIPSVMSIKSIALLIFAILSLVHCNQHPENQMNNHIDNAASTGDEFFTLYAKSQDTVKVAKATRVSPDSIGVELYEINIIPAEGGVKQRFISNEVIAEKELDVKKAELVKSYNWSPFSDDSILFIQIQPTGFKDEMELLNKRQEIEDKIENALVAKGIGKWIAGDLGSGGGNMLYSVTDMSKSLPTALEVLKENKFEDRVLICRQVKTAKDDWFYEVIYPSKFSGNFNGM